MGGKRCRFCHATEEGAQMHNQPVVTVREPFSPQFPTSSSLAVSLFRNVESRERLSLADTSNLVLGRALVADSAVLQLPEILSLQGIMLPVPVPGKNEQSTSTEGRAGMQVSASDRCERTILFPVSILAKDQINE